MKKKINILLILLSAVVGTGFYGCTADFEEINTNPHVFYEVDLDNIFPGTVQRSMKLIGEMNYNRLLNFSRYSTVQYSTNPSMERGDSFWRQFYVEIIKDIELLDRDYTGKDGYQNRSAIVKTWKSYMYYLMVSAYGPIPMSDAITETGGKRSFKYDSEAEIYTEILNMLAAADTLYNPATTLANDKLRYDPVFGGPAYTQCDLNKWRKFAATLRLNIAMHVQNMLPDLAQQHATAVMANPDRLISSVGDIVKLQWGMETENSASYYYTRYWKEPSFSSGVVPALSEYFAIYLFSYNDPRIESWAYKSNGSPQAPLTEAKYMYTDTLTRAHECGVRNCKDYKLHEVDGLNPYRRDSILVQYTMPYLPLPEMNDLPLGWEYDFIPGREQYGTRYGDPLTSNRPSTYNPSLVNYYFTQQDATMILLNWADACFLKAEYEMLYGTEAMAKTYYEDGIKASFDQWGQSGKAAAYMAQNGIAWNTNGRGYAERRLIYRANINGEGGIENHLEQIYKQRYIAGFFNGLEGWNLERRTRVLRFPPFFANGAATDVDGYNPTYNYWTERLIYPENEMSRNREAYYEGIAKLNASSPYSRPEVRHGDNVYTSLAFAKLHPDMANANDLWGRKVIRTTCEYFNHKYGSTYEEVLATAIEMTKITNPARALAAAFSYRFQEVLGTYYTDDLPVVVEPEPEP